MKTIKDLLSEASNGVISEDVIKNICDLFEQQVVQRSEERVKLAVEAAIAAEDEKNVQLFTEAVETLDRSRAQALTHLLTKQAENNELAINKLKQKFKKKLASDAAKFRDTLIESVSQFVEAEIEKHIPENMIKEAAMNTQSTELLKDLREMLAVSATLENKLVQGTIAEAKEEISKFKQNQDKVIAEKTKVEEERSKLISEKAELERKLFIEQATAKFSPNKKKFIVEHFAGKDINYIKENALYLSKHYDRILNERRSEAADTAKKTSAVAKLNTDKKILTEAKREGFVPAESIRKETQSELNEVNDLVEQMKKKSNYGI